MLSWQSAVGSQAVCSLPEFQKKKLFLKYTFATANCHCQLLPLIT